MKAKGVGVMADLIDPSTRRTKGECGFSGLLNLGRCGGEMVVKVMRRDGFEILHWIFIGWGY